MSTNSSGDKPCRKRHAAQIVRSRDSPAGGRRHVFLPMRGEATDRAVTTNARASARDWSKFRARDIERVDQQASERRRGKDK
jgi:hypothetical protein